MEDPPRQLPWAVGTVKVEDEGGSVRNSVVGKLVVRDAEKKGALNRVLRTGSC